MRICGAPPNPREGDERDTYLISELSNPTNMAAARGRAAPGALFLLGGMLLWWRMAAAEAASTRSNCLAHSNGLLHRAEHHRGGIRCKKPSTSTFYHGSPNNQHCGGGSSDSIQTTFTHKCYPNYFTLPFIATQLST